jgi:hypothetical protein
VLQQVEEAADLLDLLRVTVVQLYAVLRLLVLEQVRRLRGRQQVLDGAARRVAGDR